VPFHCTDADESKFEPLTVSVKPFPPATVELGFKEEITGAGGTMLKVTPLDVAPLSDTVTVAMPAVAIRSAVTVAFNSVALSTSVLNGAPFQSTTAALSNPVPLTLSVNGGPPAVVEVGLIEIIDGCPEEFAGAAKSTATTAHIVAIRDRFRRPADSRRILGRLAFSSHHLLIRLNIRSPTNELELSTLAGARVSAPELVLQRQCSRPRNRVG